MKLHLLITKNLMNGARGAILKLGNLALLENVGTAQVSKWEPANIFLLLGGAAVSPLR